MCSRRSPYDRAVPCGGQHKKCVLGTCGIAARRRGTRKPGTRRHLPLLEYSTVAPSVDSRTFSIKGQSSLDEQSKFYRINPPLRPPTRHAVRFVPPLYPLSSHVLIRTTTGITSATPSTMAHPECTTDACARCNYAIPHFE